MPNEDTQAQAPPVTDDEARLEAARAELIDADKKRQQLKLVQFQALEAGDRAGSAAAQAKITDLEARLAELLLLIEGPAIGGREKGLEYRAARAKNARLTADLNAAIARQAIVGTEIIAQRKAVVAKEAELKDENKKLAALNAKKTGVYEAARDLKAHQTLYSDIQFSGGN
ncbi:MAG: hypothetical protein WB438_04215 [Candidatus Cybelea sp.]